MIQAFWRNSRYAKSVQVMMDIQVAVGNPMILSHHPRIAALFLQPKQDWDDQSDEHHHCYQQQVMHNHRKHQSEDHQYRYTNPFVRWQAITNSWGNILFWHPSGTFCQLWFPGLRPSQTKAPKINCSTNCCCWRQISDIYIDNCKRNMHMFSWQGGTTRKHFWRFSMKPFEESCPHHHRID